MNLRTGETLETGPECADPVMTGLMKVAARGRRWPTTNAAAAATTTTTLRRRGSTSRDHPPHLHPLTPTRSVGALYFFSGRFSRVAVVAHHSRVLRAACISPLRRSLLVVRSMLPSSDLLMFFWFLFLLVCHLHVFLPTTDVFYFEVFLRPLVFTDITVLVEVNFHHGLWVPMILYYNMTY